MKLEILQWFPHIYARVISTESTHENNDAQLNASWTWYILSICRYPMAYRFSDYFLRNFQFFILTLSRSRCVSQNDCRKYFCKNTFCVLSDVQNTTKDHTKWGDRPFNHAKTNKFISTISLLNLHMNSNWSILTRLYLNEKKVRNTMTTTIQNTISKCPFLFTLHGIKSPHVPRFIQWLNEMSGSRSRRLLLIKTSTMKQSAQHLEFHKLTQFLCWVHAIRTYIRCSKWFKNAANHHKYNRIHSKSENSDKLRNVCGFFVDVIRFFV